MAMVNQTSKSLSRVWKAASKLTSQERILLAKYLLDSVVSVDLNDETDWQALSLTAFESDWDNPDDAVYDNWRELFDVSAR
ncbi:MAG: hypothetical protein H6659_10470 [Ardenticatenaceae bacterium]|nr:hypothetical protein [Ardenticatenaceae bacterium]